MWMWTFTSKINKQFEIREAVKEPDGRQWEQRTQQNRTNTIIRKSRIKCKKKEIGKQIAHEFYEKISELNDTKVISEGAYLQTLKHFSIFIILKNRKFFFRKPTVSTLNCCTATNCSHYVIQFHEEETAIGRKESMTTTMSKQRRQIENERCLNS